MNLLLSAIAGCLLGAAHAGHLWRDVRRYVLTGKHALRWGMLFRLMGVAVGLVIISKTGGPNFIAALIGLLLVRTVLIWRVGMVGDA